jgi:predicted phage tail protein
MNSWFLDDPNWPGGSGGSGGSGGGVNLATDANTEMARMLVAVCEGPIGGLVNGLKSVYLDDNPVQGPAGMNFKGVALALTAGYNDQAMIPDFPDVEAVRTSELNLPFAVTHAAPQTRTMITQNISAVRVSISIPTLKVIDKNTGSESGSSCQIEIWIYRSGYNGSVFTKATIHNDGIVADKFGDEYVKSYRIDLPNVGTGAWQIRVVRVTADPTDGYTQNLTNWKSLTEITDALLRYPNTAMMALKVDAKQFRSVPRLSAEYYLRLVKIPSNYTPAFMNEETGIWTPGVYTGVWDGLFKEEEAWTCNPAWIFYDIAVNTRYGAGSYLDASSLDKWALYYISKLCDETLIPDGNGGWEPRFSCNIFIQGQEDALKVLMTMASIFRGMAYFAGGLVTPVADVDASPVMIFNSANVHDGVFSYSGTAKKARHTAALVAWTNPAMGYQQSVEYVQDDAGVARYGYQPTQVTAFGCTSQGQARRLGLWTLATELLETEVVTFRAGMEGAACRPGDIIQIADPFRAGKTRMGGRVLPGTTASTVLLDDTITLVAGTYTLKCTLPSGVVESRTVTNGTGATSSLTVSSPFSDIPETMWILQLSTNMALYRVLGIREAGPVDYEVTALLHDPAKYSYESGLRISASGGLTQRSAAAPFPVTTSSYVKILNSRVAIQLDVSWPNNTMAVGYECAYSRDYRPFVQMQVAGSSASADEVLPGDYRVRVQAFFAGITNTFVTEVSLTIADPNGTPASLTIPATTPGSLTLAVTTTKPI